MVSFSDIAEKVEHSEAFKAIKAMRERTNSETLRAAVDTPEFQGLDGADLAEVASKFLSMDHYSFCALADIEEADATDRSLCTCNLSYARKQALTLLVSKCREHLATAEFSFLNLMLKLALLTSEPELEKYANVK